MAKKKTTKKKPKPYFPVKNTWNAQNKLIAGAFLILISLLLFISFLSYLFSGNADQSIISELPNKAIETQNWVSQLGAFSSDLFISKGIGISAFILVGLNFLSGLFVILNLKTKKLFSHWFWGLSFALLLCTTLGFFQSHLDIFSGTIGYETNQYLQSLVGKIGTILILVFAFIVYFILKFKLSITSLKSLYFEKIRTNNTSKADKEPIANIDNDLSQETESIKKAFDLKVEKPIEEKIIKPKPSDSTPESKELEMKVEVAKEEPLQKENKSNALVEKYGEYDPTLDLSGYQFPTLDLLKKYQNEGIDFDQAELEENKNKIVETLLNYGIGISTIHATIGPTVTLYEIIPKAGVRISKIKNLEDDIALSLSALGIRIIAPIPGKGTIGIEVPNKKASIVSMYSVIASHNFQSSKMQLPIALGKTISNETKVVDLAKMPHLLMAGATGQGKSVGLNAILTSLLYKKHPAEIKFVLVDPKKVELTLFNKIERHYLAKLPDTEEAIITDNTKVIHTLNSLCIEMDNRYDLLKNALCRNIKEYNTKFVSRKLNPNDGHKFLPYIILVVDEFADLIMTAGKEVETPIARLAQLARAIGIHLIIATQRPSVNVITGIIKANFPARIAFRVTSKIDSRTILDSVGADQLIGRGDMLLTQGNDLTRLQCAFVDTPEVDQITEFIGSQKGYPDAYLLPEYVDEESGTSLDIDKSDRDSMFKQAAEVLVIAQQGSASLLQRKLKLGYNRAGRIIDQLEAAGIVGPFEGSKARQVLVPDLLALEKLLSEEI